MFGNMLLNSFFRKKAVSKKVILFGKRLEIDYNQNMIILSWKTAYNYKQNFGAYDYKQKLIILELLCFTKLTLGNKYYII